MEASLPISAAVNQEPLRPTAPATQFGTHAPPIKLPLAFMLAGLASLAVGAAWLVIQPSVLASYHYGQNVIAVTHLFVLGWICSVVMGAMYQLVPVALETRLYSEKLARCQFVLHVIGFVGMVWMFRSWNMKYVGYFGTVTTAGVVLFVFNIVRTLLRVPRWNVTATAVTAALSWLTLGVLAGLSIATAKALADSNDGVMPQGTGLLSGGLIWFANRLSHFGAINAMHAHAHLGAVGFFTILVVGISYKLIPMFALSEVQCRRRAGLSLILLNIGLGGSFVTILMRSPWKAAFALVVVIALAIYACELLAILRARKRRGLDWGIRYFLTAVVLLLLVSLLALVLSWPGLPFNHLTAQLENLYGFLGLAGVITFAIIGMLYKIIPFLVWFGVYTGHIGRARVPALADMYSPRLQMLGYWGFLAGLAVICAGIVGSSNNVVRVGSIFYAGSILFLILNMARILVHAIRPRITPLVALCPAKSTRYEQLNSN